MSTQTACIYLLCCISFLHHLKTNKPFHYIALEKWILKNCPDIPLSLVFGLMTPQQAAWTVCTKLSLNTIMQAGELAKWAKTFAKQ